MFAALSPEGLASSTNVGFGNQSVTTCMDNRVLLNVLQQQFEVVLQSWNESEETASILRITMP